MSKNFADYTQLTNAVEFDPAKMVFANPHENKITISEGKTIKFFRIQIGYENPDGTVGELVLGTPRLFSYGVQENKADSGRIDGYSMALCMWDRDGPTPEQTRWIEAFGEAIDRAKDHILSVKDDVGKYDLDESDVKRFNPLYWKRDRGKIVEGKGPTLYPKLLVSKKEDPPKILTPFSDAASGEDVDPRDLVNKFCYATAAVRIESIYVGAKVSPQVKLHECLTRLANTRNRRLLRPTVDNSVRQVSADAISSALGASAEGVEGGEEEEEEDDDDDGTGSLSDASSSEEQKAATPVLTKKTTKKIVRRVVRRKKPVTE